MTPKRRSTSRSDSAAVGSSMMMTLAPEDAARAISTICFCATLSVETLADGSMDGLEGGQRLDDAIVELGPCQEPEPRPLHTQRQVLLDGELVDDVQLLEQRRDAPGSRGMWIRGLERDAAHGHRPRSSVAARPSAS